MSNENEFVERANITGTHKNTKDYPVTNKILIGMPKPLRAELNAVAALQGRKVTDCVREAIRNYCFNESVKRDREVVARARQLLVN